MENQEFTTRSSRYAGRRSQQSQNTNAETTFFRRTNINRSSPPSTQTGDIPVTISRRITRTRPTQTGPVVTTVSTRNLSRAASTSRPSPAQQNNSYSNWLNNLLQKTEKTIDDMIEKFKAEVEKDDATQLEKDELIFWQQAKAIEAKITNLINQEKVDEQVFAEYYEVRARNLEGMANGEVSSENIDYFHQNRAFGSIFSIVAATGATWDQISPNMNVVQSFGESLGLYGKKKYDNSSAIKRLESQLRRTGHDKQLERFAIERQIKALEEEAQLISNTYDSLFAGSMLFASRAKDFNDAQRQEYLEFIQDTIETNGEVSPGLLP